MGSRAYLLKRLGLLAAVALGSASPARVQAQPPPAQLPPTEQSAQPLIPANTPSPSQVFPDGGFPPGPAAPEAKNPALPPPPVAVVAPAIANSAPTATNAAQQPPSPEFGPPGLTPRGPQEAPGVPELFRPTAPL